MIAYTTIGTNDLEKSVQFYTDLFADTGATKLFATPRFVAFGHSMAQPFFAVVTPYNGEPATPGNGTMITLMQPNSDVVDALYAKALSLGATDEGAPGLRMGEAYCAYVRDLDGNKLNFFCMQGQ